LLSQLVATGGIDMGQDGRPVRFAPGAARLSYIPAGLDTWSHVPVGSRLRHLDVHFDAEALVRRFDGAFDPRRLAEPRLGFADAGLLGLAQLLADEVTGGGLHDLYGEGLALALFARLFEVARPEPRPGQLAGHRVRQAMDFIEANSARVVRLQELADLVGLSPAYFSSAFKAATGVAPHQWQSRARVERVKRLLAGSDATLAEVALATGFSDQAHMTRVFKRFAGTTPASWVRTQGRV
jgi:AraC-like DNA-binding protein